MDGVSLKKSWDNFAAIVMVVTVIVMVAYIGYTIWRIISPEVRVVSTPIGDYEEIIKLSVGEIILRIFIAAFILFSGYVSAIACHTVGCIVYNSEINKNNTIKIANSVGRHPGNKKKYMVEDYEEDYSEE